VKKEFSPIVKLLHGSFKEERHEGNVTHRKREEEIDIVAELLFGGIEIQQPSQ